jgi:hypothetical protein
MDLYGQLEPGLRDDRNVARRHVRDCRRKRVQRASDLLLGDRVLAYRRGHKPANPRKHAVCILKLERRRGHFAHH